MRLSNFLGEYDVYYEFISKIDKDYNKLLGYPRLDIVNAFKWEKDSKWDLLNKLWCQASSDNDNDPIVYDLDWLLNEPVKLSDVLRHYHAYEEFINNYEHIGDDKNVISIYNVFDWNSTKQGSPFWSIIAKVTTCIKDLEFDMNWLLDTKPDKYKFNMNDIVYALLPDDNGDYLIHKRVVIRRDELYDEIIYSTTNMQSNDMLIIEEKYLYKTPDSLTNALKENIKED